MSSSRARAHAHLHHPRAPRSAGRSRRPRGGLVFVKDGFSLGRRPCSRRCGCSCTGCGGRCWATSSSAAAFAAVAAALSAVDQRWLGLAVLGAQSADRLRGRHAAALGARAARLAHRLAPSRARRRRNASAASSRPGCPPSRSSRPAPDRARAGGGWRRARRPARRPLLRAQPCSAWPSSTTAPATCTRRPRPSSGRRARARPTSRIEVDRRPRGRARRRPHRAAGRRRLRRLQGRRRCGCRHARGAGEDACARSSGRSSASASARS